MHWVVQRVLSLFGSPRPFPPRRRVGVEGGLEGTTPLLLWRGVPRGEGPDGVPDKSRGGQTENAQVVQE